MKVGDGEVTWSSVGGQVGVHRSPEQSDLVIIIIFYHVTHVMNIFYLLHHDEHYSKNNRPICFSIYIWLSDKDMDTQYDISFTLFMFRRR